MNAVSVTSTHVLDFANLAFCDNNVTLTGVAQGIGSLRTITGDLTANQTLGGAIDFSGLTSADDVVVEVTNVDSITSVNFGNTTMATLKVGDSGTLLY